MALGIASAQIKTKLEDLLALLQQDTTELVDDSDPAKIIFKLSAVKLLLMLRRYLFKPLIWRATNFSTRRLFSALPIEPPMPNTKRRCCK